MKKLLFACILITVIGCAKTEVQPEPPVQKQSNNSVLVGTWIYDSSYVATDPNGTSYHSEDTLFIDQDIMRHVFNDPVVFVPNWSTNWRTEADSIFTFELIISGNDTTNTDDHEPDYTFQVNGNILHMQRTSTKINYWYTKL